MDKKQRKDKEFSLYRKRVRRWVANIRVYIDREGNYVDKPTTDYVMRDLGQLRFKSTGTPCSCYGCSGYYKYRRHEKKREDRRLLDEYLREGI